MRTKPATASQPASSFDLSLASEEQSAIFTWFRDSTVQGVVVQDLVVRARAGTGKTTTILAGAEMAPEKAILLAAFNKEIALELQSRIRNPNVEAKTLHSLGFKFVSYNWKGVDVDLGNGRATSLAEAAMHVLFQPLTVTSTKSGDGKISRELLGQVTKLIATLHSKGRDIQPFARNGRDLAELAVQFNLLPDEAMVAAGWDEDAIYASAYKAMVLAKQRILNGKPVSVDFCDMIYLPLVNNWVRPWYDLVVADEAQDMTVAQLELAQRACRRGGRICVVGDDRQAIYAFRGADSNALDNLKKALNASELGLTITRRCPKAVVRLAQELVPDFQAAPSAPEGVIRSCSAERLVEEAAVGDFILSRTNAPLVKVCMSLLKRGVRARIKGRDIGKGTQALVKKLSPASLAGLVASLNKWSDREIERATKKLPEGPRDERISFVNDQVGVLLALIDSVSTLVELDLRIEELFGDKIEGPFVMCSSVHRAKGLETQRAYLLEGTFRDGSIEEDNITYVAMTRTKNELVWVTGFEKNGGAS